jgi:hypothetical protein
MAGKGSKSRVKDYKKYTENFPKQKKEVEGFFKVKNKIRKTY